MSGLIISLQLKNTCIFFSDHQGPFVHEWGGFCAKMDWDLCKNAFGFVEKRVGLGLCKNGLGFEHERVGFCACMGWVSEVAQTHTFESSLITSPSSKLSSPSNCAS